jgi:hypothetical protein
MQDQIALPLETRSLSKIDWHIYALTAASMTTGCSELTAEAERSGSGRSRASDFVRSPSSWLNRLEAGRAYSPLLVAVRLIRRPSARLAASRSRVPRTRPREAFCLAVAVRSFLELGAVKFMEYAACVN